MAQHLHEWDTSYEFRDSTYRECAEPDCRGYQQWICALDRWSDPFETPSPRGRETEYQAEQEAASVG